MYRSTIPVRSLFHMLQHLMHLVESAKWYVVEQIEVIIVFS